MSTLLIPLADYARIFKLTYSALCSANADVTKACLVYSLSAVTVLRDHYGLNASVTAGGAAYVLNGEHDAVLVFGNDQEGRLQGTPEAFHAWVECEGCILDFSAPLFAEMTGQADALPFTVPRRMFQKPLAQAAQQLQDLKRDGEFFLARDSGLAERLLTGLPPIYLDIVQLAAAYYRKPPRALAKHMPFNDSKLGPRNLEVHGPAVSGVW